jgi:hypothetical protein
MQHQFTATNVVPTQATFPRFFPTQPAFGKLMIDREQAGYLNADRRGISLNRIARGDEFLVNIRRQFTAWADRSLGQVPKRQAVDLPTYFARTRQCGLSSGTRRI